MNNALDFSFDSTIERKYYMFLAEVSKYPDLMLNKMLCLSFKWITSLLILLPPDSYSLSCTTGLCVAAIILLVCSWLAFKLSFLCVLGLCGLVLQRDPGSNIATAIHFATTVYTCSCPETLAEKCKLLFINLNTDFHSLYYCHCAQVHLELLGHSPAFIAQILHTFLFESCDALTSLLCLGCSHIVFNLAAVA